MPSAALRFVQNDDGEYYVNIRDLTALFVAKHDQVTAEGRPSIYDEIAVALSTPFMEMEGFVPGGLHTEPGGAGEDR
jgi:hypothetical protein